MLMSVEKRSLRRAVRSRKFRRSDSTMDTLARQVTFLAILPRGDWIVQRRYGSVHSKGDIARQWNRDTFKDQQF